MFDKYKIFGVRNYQVGDKIKSDWTQLGIGRVNKDGSIGLKFNFIPVEANTTIVLQKAKEFEGDR